MTLTSTKINKIISPKTGVEPPSNLRYFHRRINQTERVLKSFEDEHSICIADSWYEEINQISVEEVGSNEGNVGLDDFGSSNGSGGTGITDGGFIENDGPVEPEPSYGDGGSHVNEVVDTSYEECAYYADQDYKCVPYYNCEDGEIVTDGGGLIDIRSSFAAVLDPASSKCPGYLEVCCRHPDFSTNSPQTTTPEPFLTGAHCVDKIPKNNIKIRCGEWDTQKEIEPSQHQDRFVEDVKIHPQFNPKNLKNDFALLFMEEDFKLAPHVDTICLPDNLAGIDSYDQNDCFATGWGKDKFGKLGEYQVIMKQVQMDMVNSNECENKLRRTRLGEDFELDESFVCAGGEKDRDTCKGDGGGPLVCPLHREGSNDGYGVIHETKYVQAGIIAWGIDCGLEGNPGVYANVADGLCFIDWATQCQTGIPQYFNITGCENWAPQQIESLKYDIHEHQKKLDYISKDGSGTPSNLRNLNRRIKQAEGILKIFQDEHSICIASSGYGEINQVTLGEVGRNQGDVGVDGFGSSNGIHSNQDGSFQDSTIVDQDQFGSEHEVKPIVESNVPSGY
ncbi:Phenoloxidase-activating factor 2 [Lepeophtheirus salmonis]|uniref:Phenoloxidase-activating factor 2 n=1 Tax=Lepeophtheirus salmonis TaxID=72036 RepID=A0A7R8HA18_LEPSM|nr:Phenoloxidase-activating factor 2 [Lepeophtheirus salmonis]CAF2966168.1 Phenoloxidase-activating factor 2 [Lepeophtheirus salmonis]